MTTVGYCPSVKSERMIQFESLLEKKFISILEFDSNVINYYDQPVKIYYTDHTGNRRSYIPDFLVEYKNRKSVYFEVKYESYLKANWQEVKPKFAAANLYAKACLSEFKVFKDTQINSTYQENVEFLLGYTSQPIEIETKKRIVETLEKLGKSTPNDLIKFISSSSEDGSHLIRPLWILISNKIICCNLFQNLHMNSTIWLNRNNNSFKLLNYPYRYAKINPR
jgi:hypothetical protein